MQEKFFWHRSRAEAMAVLKSRLYELELGKRQAEADKLEAGKTDVGRGHQIRSCVPDNSRIKDLRTNVEISPAQKVLDGDLDAFLEASLKQGVQESAPAVRRHRLPGATPEGPPHTKCVTMSPVVTQAVFP